MTLDELGFPNIRVESDGTMINDKTQRVIYEAGQPTKHVRLTGPHGNTRLFWTHWLLRYCFTAPWRNPNIPCKHLDYMQLSRYWVTADGQVFGARLMAYLRPHTTHDGYLTVMLWDDNKRIVPWRVARLIAQAFIPNPENKDTINHIDGNKLNNSVENLEWVWAWENKDHARRTGLYSGPTDEQIIEICHRLERGEKQFEIARAMGINRSVVKDILYGSHYRITKDFNIPRYNNQLRMPVEFREEKVLPHGQGLRKRELPPEALPCNAGSSTTN